MNCPICDKVGLAKDATFCPQCNSDLSGFIAIQKVATHQQNLEKEQTIIQELLQKSKLQRRNLILWSSFLVLLTIGVFLGLNHSKSNNSFTELPVNQGNTDSLQIIVIENQRLINTIKMENERLKSHTETLKYVVRKGDNLSKIARFFYNKETHYRKIMDDNNLRNNPTIAVGDSLIINLEN
jgi:nucleoid-associated protein YgaU